jgi:hypothetical protein
MDSRRAVRQSKGSQNPSFEKPKAKNAALGGKGNSSPQAAL